MGYMGVSTLPGEETDVFAGVPRMRRREETLVFRHPNSAVRLCQSPRRLGGLEGLVQIADGGLGAPDQQQARSAERAYRGRTGTANTASLPMPIVHALYGRTPVEHPVPRELTTAQGVFHRCDFDTWRCT